MEQLIIAASVGLNVFVQSPRGILPPPLLLLLRPRAGMVLPVAVTRLCRRCLRYVYTALPDLIQPTTCDPLGLRPRCACTTAQRAQRRDPDDPARGPRASTAADFVSGSANIFRTRHTASCILPLRLLVTCPPTPATRTIPREGEVEPWSTGRHLPPHCRSLSGRGIICAHLSLDVMAE